MLKNARIEQEGREHRRRGLGRAGCPYTGLDAVDWLRGYEDEKLQELRGKAFPRHVKISRPLQAASPRATIPPESYNRLQLQAKQLALAVLDMDVSLSKGGAKAKQLARKLLDGGPADDEASWAAVAARLQPHLRK